MAVKSLKDLFADEIKDLYSAEKQITLALPKMADKARSRDLKNAFQEHLKQTENHINRLEKVFDELGISPKGKKCEAMEGIINEGEDMMKEAENSEVMDAALISAAQKVEHYEMASYGTVRTYAEQLGLKNSRKLLQDTLDEESKTNEKLTNLALHNINEEAVK